MSICLLEFFHLCMTAVTVFRASPTGCTVTGCTVKVSTPVVRWVVDTLGRFGVCDSEDPGVIFLKVEQLA